MNKKPSELTGEVEKFIEVELFGNPEIEGNVSLKSDIIEWYHERDIRNRIIKDFYNQPFTAEMISEYFEGWRTEQKYSTNVKYIYGEDSNFDYIIFLTGNTKIFKIEKNMFIDCAWTLYPKTLSDFISAALNSGIKLRWK